MAMTVVTGAFPRQLDMAAANDGFIDTMTDADFRGCRWIEGEPRPLRHGMFCGLPVGSGESWCARHRHIVFCQEVSLAG